MKRIVFGTMRMAEWTKSRDDWIRFFDNLWDSGIRTLHASHEYESFPILCDLFSDSRQSKINSEFRLVVKLGEPSFDDGLFDVERLSAKVDSYLLRLGVERLDIVQWMWRSSLKQDDLRCNQFVEHADEIAHAFQALCSAGKVVQWRCFPYTVSFAQKMFACAGIEGSAVYRNPWETEYDEFISNQTHPVLTIRPFAAGKGFQIGNTADAMLDYALSPSAVDAVVVTATDDRHVEKLTSYAKKLLLS